MTQDSSEEEPPSDDERYDMVYYAKGNPWDIEEPEAFEEPEEFEDSEEFGESENVGSDSDSVETEEDGWTQSCGREDQAAWSGNDSDSEGSVSEGSDIADLEDVISEDGTSSTELSAVLDVERDAEELDAEEPVADVELSSDTHEDQEGTGYIAVVDDVTCQWRGCGQIVSRVAWKKHMTTVHCGYDKTYVCHFQGSDGICGRKYDYPQSLRRHVKETHFKIPRSQGRRG